MPRTPARTSAVAVSRARRTLSSARRRRVTGSGVASVLGLRSARVLHHGDASFVSVGPPQCTGKGPAALRHTRPRSRCTGCRSPGSSEASRPAPSLESAVERGPAHRIRVWSSPDHGCAAEDHSSRRRSASSRDAPAWVRITLARGAGILLLRGTTRRCVWPGRFQYSCR